MTYRITIQVEFCAGHRLLGHMGKCENYHGHNYSADFHIKSERVDTVGRVVDFADIKRKAKAWIETNWDHAMILHQHDPLLAAFKQQNSKVYTMTNNPTAEHMAEVLYGRAKEWLGEITTSDRIVELGWVRLFETPTCCAMYAER